MFLDRATIRVRSGRGGGGCASFRRLKFKPRGGPDGGDGGRGGSVYLRASTQLATLYDFFLQPVYAAENGTRGAGNNRTGGNGKDLIVDVPCGTEVWLHPMRRMLADMVTPNERVLIARGGAGGRGNKHFATAVNQAPRTTTEGGPGEEVVLDLELKLIADVGLVGLPNAGKSALLRALSRARPRVADYPFTTRYPHLGICEPDAGRRLVIADIPGIIEGAHDGAGLGHEFLRHVERTKMLAHLVSNEHGGAPEIAAAFRMLERELALAGAADETTPRIAVLTKLDLLPDDDGARLVKELGAALGMPVQGISAVSGAGLPALCKTLWDAVHP
ncbi:MAG TPA: GTPase ObgE [Planctomycetes bacterium]|nr:GTPase ObgE [Planctomycetota bacterium]